MQTYVLTTERMGLRLLEATDLYYLESLEKDAEVKQYFPEGPSDKIKTEIMIKKFLGNYTRLGLPCFLIFDLQTNEFMGRAGFGMTKSDEIEVGYVFHKKFWRKGFATEVLSVLLQWAREHIKSNYIIAYADLSNIGSWRAMEKCGMKFYKKGYEKALLCKFYKMKIK